MARPTKEQIIQKRNQLERERLNAKTTPELNALLLWWQERFTLATEKMENNPIWGIGGEAHLFMINEQIRIIKMLIASRIGK